MQCTYTLLVPELCMVCEERAETIADKVELELCITQLSALSAIQNWLSSWKAMVLRGV